MELHQEVEVKCVFWYLPQCGGPQQTESDDRGQPGRGVWPHINEATRGDYGRHHGSQVPEHCGGNPHRTAGKGNTVESISTMSIGTEKKVF